MGRKEVEGCCQVRILCRSLLKRCVINQIYVAITRCQSFEANVLFWPIDLIAMHFQRIIATHSLPWKAENNFFFKFTNMFFF